MASGIFFVVQLISVCEAGSPVWYPYYGAWFIGTLVESFLLVVPNVLVPRTTYYQFAAVGIQVLRVCNLLALLIVYFALRTQPEEFGE